MEAVGLRSFRSYRKGPLLIRVTSLFSFDDTTLKDRLIEQEILVAQNKASLIQAENDLVAAGEMAKEYNKGTYNLELETVEAEIAVSREKSQACRGVSKV